MESQSWRVGARRRAKTLLDVSLNTIRNIFSFGNDTKEFLLQKNF
jgi:hypothetical protein